MNIKPRVSMDFNLVDSSVTETLGQALARSLPGAVKDGVMKGEAASRNAAPMSAAPENAAPESTVPVNAVPRSAAQGNAAPGSAVLGDTTPGDTPRSAMPGEIAPKGAMPVSAVREDVSLGSVIPGHGAGGAVAAGAAVLYLQGELGAGKTTCVRGLLRALGVTGPVRSPTYALLETYSLDALTCVHVDLYRLRTLTEVDELGLRDLVGPGCLLLVEWPERGGAALPPADVDLTLRYAGDARQAHVSAATPLGSQWLENLGHDRSLSFYVSNLT